MSISKITLASAGLIMMASTALSVPALAGSNINNANDCQFEGGTMTNVKGSDYCLVQIRPKEYSGTEYDGNQLGVVDCPGNKLNDGIFCMYPVTVKKTATPASSLLGMVQGNSAKKTAPSTSGLLDMVQGNTADASMKDKAGTALLKNKILGGGKSTTNVLVDVAKDEAKKRAEEEAKKAAAKLLGGN